MKRLYDDGMKNYRLLLISLTVTATLALAKLAVHTLGWEGITLGSLHSSVITGTFFVIGFLLSATIADYKESEKIPAEIASIVQNMHEDGEAIKQQYPKFNQQAFKKQLLELLEKFRQDVRDETHEAHHYIHQLNDSFISMEKAGVPANFIVKFKQQQAQLLRSLLRVNYIQTITFLPSATILTYCIVILTTGLLLFTEIEPFYGGIALTAIIGFILIYILNLIRVASVPFHGEGKTKDDVSLYLISQAADHLKKD